MSHQYGCRCVECCPMWLPPDPPLKKKPDIEQMRMLLKLVCLGDEKAAALLDTELMKLL